MLQRRGRTIPLLNLTARSLHVMSPETENRETRATEMSPVGSQDQSGL